MQTNHNQSNDKSEIRINNFSYQYPKGNTPSLLHITLEAEKGQVLIVMGKTGSGKTTLLCTLNGLVPHFFEGSVAGDVYIEDKNTGQLPVYELVRKVGLVLQDPETQIFGLTVEKDSAFGPSNLAYDREIVRKNVDRALQAVGLDNYKHRSPDQLSGGEKQRLAIAGVLAMECPILVMDEPTSELDPEGVTVVQRTLQQLKSSGDYTIVFSTHNPYHALEAGDRIAVLDQAQLVFTGSITDLFGQAQLLYRYGIQPPEITDLFARLKELDLHPETVLPFRLGEGSEKLHDILNRLEVRADNSITFRPPSRIGPGHKIIEIRNLTHCYEGGIVALKDISLEIQAGEIIAVLGKNGAGKTTLAKHLIGLLRPTSGSIRLNGNDIKNQTVEELSRTIGYVFQNPDHQIFSATVFEEIAYGLKNRDLDTAIIRQRVAEALAFTGLENCEHKHPFTLSKGERQKVAIASVLAMQPEIIIIDEPTTGLDWDGSLQVMQKILELKARGHTIIIITHNMRLTAEFADRVILMSSGSIIREGEVHQVLRDITLLQQHALEPTQVSLLVQRLASRAIPDEIITVNEMIDYIKFKYRI